MSRPAWRTACDGDGVAAAHQLDDVVAVLGRHAPPRGARAASAGPAATASRQPVLPQRQATSARARDAHVAEVAGRALGAALQLARRR